MTAGWAALLLLAVVYAVFVTVWNLMLMRLLDIAKRDVQRLSSGHQVRQALHIVEHARHRVPAKKVPAPKVPAQRGGAR